MSTDHLPDLDHLLGRTFIRVGIALGLAVIAYLFYKQVTRPEMEVISANEVRLQRQQDGQYHINGAINGEPVVFILDTGASMVSISGKLASRAGLGCDQATVFVTASGRVNGCITRTKEVTFGNYRLFDLDVAIVPNMDELALLGMNALGKFNLQQTGRTLTIAQRPASQ
jgi:clan AA aspartic protease (TIGR02281 family)